VHGKKSYSQSKRDIFVILYDVIELQKGEMIVSDTRSGKLLYSLTMYDYVWELLYDIAEIDTGKCEISIQVTGERFNKKAEILRQFALLDSMLNGGADVKLIEN